MAWPAPIRTLPAAAGFGAAGADKPCEPHDLSGADLEAHAPHPASALEPGDGQNDVSSGGRRGGHALLRCTPRHLLDEPRWGDVPPGVLGDKATVTENADAAGDAWQLVEAVGDVDDRHPFAHEAADMLEEEVALRGREGRGRLVENQHAALAVEGAGDLDELTLADPEPGKRHPGGEIPQPDALERHAGPAMERGPVDDAEAAREPIEKQVLGEAHAGKEVHLLEHHHDARPLRRRSRAGGVGVIPQGHRSGVGPDQAPQDRGQGRFSRAVGAHQNMDLPRLQAE